MSLNALTLLQASSGEWVSFGLRSRRSLPPSIWVPCPVLRPTILSLILALSASWCLSLSAPQPPSPFHRTTVLVLIPSLPIGEYFRVCPARPLPFGPPWPWPRRPPKRCQGPVPYPPPPPSYSMLVDLRTSPKSAYSSGPVGRSSPAPRARAQPYLSPHLASSPP